MQGDEAINALDETRAHAGNLARLRCLLASPPSVEAMGSFDALRCIARDRLSYAGQVADIDAARDKRERVRGAHLTDLPRRAGLNASFAFGSRGLTLAALAAERIAAQVLGEPAPMERALLNAIDPARELLRALRRGQTI